MKYKTLKVQQNISEVKEDEEQVVPLVLLAEADSQFDYYVQKLARLYGCDFRKNRAVETMEKLMKGVCRIKIEVNKD